LIHDAISSSRTDAFDLAARWIAFFQSRNGR
jgi:hypothetical protein